MKEWNVNYSFTIQFDTVVKAPTKKQAIKKMKEVLGKDVNVDEIWEVHS